MIAGRAGILTTIHLGLAGISKRARAADRKLFFLSATSIVVTKLRESSLVGRAVHHHRRYMSPLKIGAPHCWIVRDSLARTGKALVDPSQARKRGRRR